MFASLELFAYGAATVIDMVLLITLIDARNYARIMLPIVLLACGTWLFHLGSFLRAYFADLTTPWAGDVQWWIMSIMALGLMLMPSAMLHLLLRISHTGLQAHPRREPRMGLAYLPLLAVPLAISRVAPDSQLGFLEAFHPFVIPYVVWASCINIFAALACFRWKPAEQPWLYRFLGSAILAMTALIAVATSFALAWPNWLPFLQALAVLAPLLPVVLFTYFVVRFNFLQVFFERTVLYAAVAIVLSLVYQLALHDVHARLEERYGINAEILQGTLIFVLVLLIPQLRRRILEALHYLVTAGRIRTLREQIRRIAIHISEHAGESPAALFDRFTNEIRTALGLSYAAGWLRGSSDQLALVAGDDPNIVSDQLSLLYQELAARPHLLVTLRNAPTPEVRAAIASANASGAMAFAAKRVRGLIVFGRRARNRDYGEEEANILMVLAEQLAVAMDNSLLQAQRLDAERRAFQNERLTTLGMLAGAIAHEVKNPLSSIKAIATVVAEDLGPESPHSDDLRLVINETHRLAQTTSQLLGFARPNADRRAASCVATTLQTILAILRHHARQLAIDINAEVPEGLPAVCLAGTALQEVLFNLLTNAIEAAGRGGQVSIRCAREESCVVTEIHDSGAGIAPEIQDQLFQPFITTKEAGTGLGLYAVSCHVREAGGEIQCLSRTGQGTTFVIRLPIANP